MAQWIQQYALTLATDYHPDTCHEWTDFRTLDTRTYYAHSPPSMSETAAALLGVCRPLACMLKYKTKRPAPNYEDSF